MNSLNQTIYFLRRVFEADFSDELSPGYLHHESEVIWLDPEPGLKSQCQVRRADS